MRDIRDGNCPLCGHHQIVEAPLAEYGDQNAEYAAAVTAEPRWVLDGRNPRHPRGALMIYFCRACGFAQQFVQDPAEVPVNAEYKTRVIDGVRTKGPFR